MGREYHINKIDFILWKIYSYPNFFNRKLYNTKIGASCDHPGFGEIRGIDAVDLFESIEIIRGIPGAVAA
jgi:hypothetical protein